MAQHSRQRPPADGANRGIRPVTMNYAVQTGVDVSTETPVRRKARVMEDRTVENRLTIKAVAADHAELDEERSLGQMTDEEIRNHLFGE